MELPEIKKEIEDYECCGLICRLCLSEESLEDVFKDGFFQEWISDFLSIKVTTKDRLSQSICAICRIRLTEFHQYRIRCHEVQGVLQALAEGTPIGVQTGDSGSLPVDPNAENQLQPIVETKVDERPEDALDVEMEVDSIDVEEDICANIKKDETHSGDEEYSSDESASHSKAVRNKNKGDINGSSDHKCHVCDKQLASWEELMAHCDTKKHLNKVERMRISGSEDDSSSVTSNTMSDDADSDRSDQSEQESDDENDNGDDNEEEKNEEGRYACSECGRTFRRQCQLKYHKAIHDENYNGELSDKESSISEKSTMGTDKPKQKQKLTKAQKRKQASEQLHNQEHRCEICNKVFATRKKYTNHRLYHRPKKVQGPQEYPCDECDSVFPMKVQLYHHKKYHKAIQRLKQPAVDTEAETDKPTEANSNKTDTDQNLVTADPPTGAEKDADNPFQCDFCPRSFPTTKKLLVHRRNIHGPKKHRCDVCDVQFILRLQMTKHVYSKKHLKNLKEKWANENKANENVPDKSGKNITKIKDSDLLENDALYVKYKATRYSDDYNKQCKCEECGKVFPNIWSLSNHKKYHRPITIECNVCGKPCYNTAALKRHIVTHQSVEERQHKNVTHECEICGYQFPLKEFLTRHIKSHVARGHTKEDFQSLKKLAPKKGKVKNRKADNAGTKKDQLSSKNGKAKKQSNEDPKQCAKPSAELPFPCDICKKSFETQLLLFRHKRYLHQPKRFKCPVCGKCFAYRKQRNMHMRGHNRLLSDSIKDFECEECHNIYPSWTSLYKHISEGHIKRKTLSEARTVPCQICNKMFQTQTSKDLHVRTVHASVEYKCHICDIVFPIRVKLSEHMTKQHENKSTTSASNEVSKPDESAENTEQPDQKDISKDKEPAESETPASSRKQPQINVKTRSGKTR